MKRFCFATALGALGCASDASPPLEAIDAEPIARSDYADEIAQEWCEARDRCGCESTRYPNVDACVYEVAEEEEALAEELLADGLVYDATCAGERAQRIAARACDWAYDLQGDDPCPVFHGDKPLGVSCSRFGPESRYSDCDRGLKCERYDSPRTPEGERTCVRVSPEIRGLGDSCVDPDAADWAPGFACSDGLYCDGELCAALVPIGESCEHVEACGPDARCDGLRGGLFEGIEPGLCTAKPGVGEACPTFGSYLDPDFDSCESGICTEGTCVAPGEPCPPVPTPTLDCVDDQLETVPAVCYGVDRSLFL